MLIWGSLEQFGHCFQKYIQLILRYCTDQFLNRPLPIHFSNFAEPVKPAAVSPLYDYAAGI